MAEVSRWVPMRFRMPEHKKEELEAKLRELKFDSLQSFVEAAIVCLLKEETGFLELVNKHARDKDEEVRFSWRTQVEEDAKKRR